MGANTLSQIINHAASLEDKLEKFYDLIANSFYSDKDSLLALSKENKKEKISIRKIYSEIVSDALEIGFSFGDINIDEFSLDNFLKKEGSLKDTVSNAIDCEGIVKNFYLLSAKGCKNFFQNIARVFERAAEKKDIRIQKLKDMVDG